MTFLDTGILVGALLEKHPEHAQCRAALEESEGPFTGAHALAETFATLTGFYKVPTAAAAELTLGLKSSLGIEPLPLADYESAIGEARQRGVMDGGIHDSLRATFADGKAPNASPPKVHFTPRIPRASERRRVLFDFPCP